MTVNSYGGTADWRVYRGTGVPGPDGVPPLPPAPPWRTFGGGPVLPTPCGDESESARRLGLAERPARVDEHQLDVINAALTLRRPLLVTGRPGSGKSTLAYRIARELALGPVLYWPISSRTTLQDGLYSYDAIGRVQDTAAQRAVTATVGGAGIAESEPLSIGAYISLGPLGTALLPYQRPRVLLVDELDKSDIDLPNDLLSVFEEGAYTIPELVRLRSRDRTVEVLTEDRDASVPIHDGRVQCREFPVVVITSNGEREFPPALLRRCIRLDLAQPTSDQLAAMVAAHFSPDVAERARDVILEFTERSSRSGGLATDQLLNAVHLMTAGRLPAGGSQWDELMTAVWRRLGEH
jgi:MoxR-like ATPase